MRLLAGLIAMVAVVVFKTGSRESEGLRVREEPSRIVLRWKGNVQAPMLDKFKQAYDSVRGDSRPIVISLDSNGGSVLHGSDLITFILQMQTTRNVDTIVERGSKCASMCVPIYLAGGHRTAAADARFMFHEVSYSRSVDVELKRMREQNQSFDVSKAKRFLVNAGTDNLFDRYLKTAGADPAWMNKMRAEVRGRDVWRSAKQLVEQRSGVIHELE